MKGVKGTRVERKIVATLVAVALVPFLATLVLGRDALREAYSVGVNPEMREQLDGALEIYRTHLQSVRADALRTTTALGNDHALVVAVAAGDGAAAGARLEALLDAYEGVGRIVVRGRDGATLASREDGARLNEATMRIFEREAPLAGDTGATLVATIATPRAPFDAYQRAGEVRELYGLLDAGATHVSDSYLATFVVLLLSVVSVAIGVGIVLARRVTGRVGALAAATERVGRGDLSVEVPSDADDEIGELTRAFNAMVRDLRESRERIDYLQRIGAWQEFARRLAHEIKNPLTPIQLAAQEVHEAYRGDDAKFKGKLQDARAIIEEEVATLRRLVGEFSSFAKLPEATLVPSDLGEFVRDAQKTLGADTDGSVEITYRVADGPMPVGLDAMMMKRCLDNLVRNAAQATRAAHAEGRGHVVVEARRAGADVILEVRDDGPGVPEDGRSRVFDPYYTTKAEGTGLGLAIVKKVVLEHGGDVSCEAAPEGGACFRIRLPVEERER